MSTETTFAASKVKPTILHMRLTRSALDRLVTDDPELKVSIRDAVLENFCRASLREALREPAARDLANQLVKALKIELKSELLESGNFDGVRFQGVAKTAIKSLIHNLLNKKAEEEVERLVVAALKSHRENLEDRVALIEARLTRAAEARIEEMFSKVDARLDEHFEKRVKTEVQRRLEAAAKEN